MSRLDEDKYHGLIDLVQQIDALCDADDVMVSLNYQKTRFVILNDLLSQSNLN